jgi:hypothetical protein
MKQVPSPLFERSAAASGCRRSAAAIAVALGFATVAAPAAVVNPGFDQGPDGLADWQVVGSVYNTGQQAVLSDDDPTAARSMVWQEVSVGAGPHSLEFDLLASLAGVGAPGTLPDTVFVSLYALPTPALFDPVAGTGFSGFLAILDLDRNGVSASAPGLTWGPSPKGPAYLRASLEFTPADAFVAPVFELANLNFLTADSVAAIDNVTITVVPEPRAALLVFPVLAATALRRKRADA